MNIMHPPATSGALHGASGWAVAVLVLAGLASPAHAAVNASQTLVLQTAGTERARINTIGLGIGTTPQQELHVSAPSSGDILVNSINTGISRSIHLRVDGSNAFINNMDNFVNNGSSSNGTLYLTGQQGISLGYGNTGSAGTMALRITPDGNIGIGTATPAVALEVNGNIRASTPVATNDVATKAYVDTAVAAASSGRPKYMGATSTSYDGTLGGGTPVGLQRGHTLCNAQYPGSRMMLNEDIAKTDFTTPITVATGWVHCSRYMGDRNNYQCDGFPVADFGTAANCGNTSTNAWNYANSSAYAMTFSSTHTPARAACDTSRPIHCVKD